MKQCNICGGTEFRPGPNGRMSSTGKPPLCGKCFSLERHRTYREILLELKKHGLVKGKAIQFSPDKTAEADWFDEFEVSVYGGENSLDIQKIDRPNKTYDLILCNHVLEHVPYDNAALCELMRILNKDGLLFFAVPAPVQNKVTRDWGFPKEEDHGHYRIYGDDFRHILQKYLEPYHISSVDKPNPVTEMPERVYFATKSRETQERLQNALGRMEIINAP